MPDNQLRLQHDGHSLEGSCWQKVLSELRRVVDQIGLKEASFVLDVKASQLSHALNERDRHYFRAEWILPLLLRASDLGLARALVGPAGLDVEAKILMTAEEKLARLERTIAESLGPQLRETLYDKAWRRG